MDAAQAAIHDFQHSVRDIMLHRICSGIADWCVGFFEGDSPSILEFCAFEVENAIT